ncbi:cardiolipin synthase [Roseivirga misakiensis]|uniref:Cardiolipin synthase n=1 Tax=Roseivirga misakiensis TaxID=1563681 RepID=A0A1E5T1P5_9BACT|nr:cardiolipin synthase [Roseivirga misakiensis]OEK05281.1 cardiolipin synthase [Roseivirga misakiensis]
MIALWQSISPFLLPLYYVGIFFVVIQILLENRNPLKTHSYLLLLLLVPFVGLVIYLFFGQNHRKLKIMAKRRLINQAFGPEYIQDYLKNEQTEVHPQGHFDKLIRFLHKDLSPISLNNRVTVLHNGEEKFPAVMEAIENAKHHIHIEYYIFDNDSIGKPLAELLIKKAKQGVKVRMIVDGVGSLGLKKAFFKKMLSGGVQLKEYMPVLFPSFTSKINYRDHRKIIIVDGKIGFTGGINVDDRYINGGQNSLYWRDTHLKIEGEAVKTLQFLFFLNWQFVSQETIRATKQYFPEITNLGKHCIQINASGPELDLASIMDSFFIAITSAKNRIRISTPYFIPTESIIDAITTAAKSDVDVELMIPFDSDSRIVQAASFSFIKRLLQAGVKVYLYQRGFLHAKVIIIDDGFASVGTANMDYRSFDLNHEVNTYIYDDEVVGILQNQFDQDLQDSEKIDLNKWENRGIKQKLKESLCRLLAPLL